MVEVLAQMEEPKNRKQLRRFMGMANQLRKLVQPKPSRVFTTPAGSSEPQEVMGVGSGTGGGIPEVKELIN